MNESHSPTSHVWMPVKQQLPGNAWSTYLEVKSEHFNGGSVGRAFEFKKKNYIYIYIYISHTHTHTHIYIYIYIYIYTHISFSKEKSCQPLIPFLWTEPLFNWSRAFWQPNTGLRWSHGKRPSLGDKRLRWQSRIYSSLTLPERPLHICKTPHALPFLSF